MGISQVIYACVGEGAGGQKKDIPDLEESNFQCGHPKLESHVEWSFRHTHRQMMASVRGPEVRDGGWNC